MNLSLGQEELDREAGYYVRPASPEPPIERWPPREAAPPRVARAPAPRITPDHYVDEPEGYYPPAPHEYYRYLFTTINFVCQLVVLYLGKIFN